MQNFFLWARVFTTLMMKTEIGKESEKNKYDHKTDVLGNLKLLKY
nr:MAG TPA: hypothetical protein [Caudoviricetes sp.]